MKLVNVFFRSKGDLKTFSSIPGECICMSVPLMCKTVIIYFQLTGYVLSTTTLNECFNSLVILKPARCRCCRRSRRRLVVAASISSSVAPRRSYFQIHKLHILFSFRISIFLKITGLGYTYLFLLPSLQTP